MAHDTSLTERREPSGLRPWLVVGVGLGTLGLVATVLGAVWLFQRFGGSPAPASFKPTVFAPPQLQSDPAGDLRDYQAAQYARLTGYAWADRELGLVQIPIERAMAMIASRGSGAFDPLDPARIPDPRR
ncbi:MAG: hypothetical protein EON47_00015 [Acetobacteraceae bacterium]|nr:MAG: hypothetical protein EON47_00015 [Acetobacteraceae bacterium]